MKKFTLNVLTLSCVAVLTGCASDQSIIVMNSHPTKPAKISTDGNNTKIELPENSETSSKDTTSTSSDTSDDAWSWLTPKNSKKSNETSEEATNTTNSEDADAKKASDDFWAEILGRKDTKSDDDDDWGDEEETKEEEGNKASNAEKGNSNLWMNMPYNVHTPNNKNNNKSDDDWGDDEEETAKPTNTDSNNIKKLLKAQKEIDALKAKLAEAEEKLEAFESKTEEEEGDDLRDELAKAQEELEALKTKLTEAEAKLPKPAAESDFFKAIKASDAFELDGTGAMEGRMQVTKADYSDSFNGIVMTIDNAKSITEDKVVLSTADGVKNGRSSDNSLNSFKLDGNTTVNLTDLTSSRFYRELKASDFSEGTFSGTGFVGGNSAESSYSAKQSDVRYGVYTANGNSVLFVNGKPSGRVFAGRYVGNAFYGKDGEYKALKDAFTANVSLSDINNPTGKIDIAINVGNGEILNFGGDVNGNTFEGNRGDAETKGGFYGLGDIGGIFHVTKEGDQKGYNGVFGGSNK